ncbi:MAG: ParB/RepB/Spo0J family partition protein, partial [Microbacterium chocolatum]|nr:ParB/RepB/Spo0J family partition protein [Microbacterium chocolatum]
VPVFIVDANDEDTASRIIEQLVENEHRDALRDHERVEAWKQLEIEGLSVAQIAKRTGTTRDTIKTGLAVAASVTGTELVADGTLTLDQAATLIEFESDPEVMESLTQTALDHPDYFPVAVERARREAKANATRAAVAEAEAAKGHTILEDRPYTDPAYVNLHHLRTPEGSRSPPRTSTGKPAWPCTSPCGAKTTPTCRTSSPTTKPTGTPLRPTTPPRPRHSPAR